MIKKRRAIKGNLILTRIKKNVSNSWVSCSSCKYNNICFLEGYKNIFKFCAKIERIYLGLYYPLPVHKYDYIYVEET